MESTCSPAVDDHDSAQTSLQALVETIIRTPDLSWQVSRALEQALLRRPDAEKADFLRRSALLGAHLQNASDKLLRQHDTSCNVAAWPLSYDLTIKVFSHLGMHSLCQAAAACVWFKKVAMEPACYRDIDLTDRNLLVGNVTVAKLINRAGQHLRSLKLSMPVDCKKEIRTVTSFGDAWRKVVGNVLLTKYCLEPLHGAVGALLQTLHLRNVVVLDSTNVCKVLAACPGLLDLEIIGLHVNERKVFESLSLCCHELTRLCVQSPKSEFSNKWISYSLRTSSCEEIINGCPNISSLSLQGFRLSDQKVKLLLQGLHHLLEVDFSGAYMLTGSFFRNMASRKDIKLRSLKLCDCMSLKAVEVNELLSLLSLGECENLRHLDVSSKHGLVKSDFDSSLNEDTLLYLLAERPEIKVRAELADEESESESMSLTSSLGYSECIEPIHENSLSEISLSENSYSMRSSSMIDTDTELDTNEDEDEDDNDEDNNGNDEDAEDMMADDVEFNIDALNDTIGNDDSDFLSPCYSPDGNDRSSHCHFG